MWLLTVPSLAQVRNDATAAGILIALGGTVIAYLDTAAFFGSEFVERMSEVPTVDLLLVLIGLPTAATLGGWLLSGRERTRLAGSRIE